uniref:C2H2-type domain-containing protein n=1 Tax=Nomascus leucogenys TaxID=61853 RepID=A0A2I3HLS0_NOMLE
KKKQQLKPWCWYCNRDFGDEKILIQHQEAKHFKCHICHKTLYPGPDIELEIYEKDMDEGRRLLEQTQERIPLLMPGIIPPVTQTQAVSAPGILNRPPAPTATIPAPQPPVTKPLFSSAGQAQAAVQEPVGTDFKPLNSTPETTTAPPKPIFSAYTQSTDSTTSTTNSTAAKPAASITSKPATLVTTNATSKLIHPDEGIYLEERRAQLPRDQHNLLLQGEAPISNPPVGPIGGIPQQQGVRSPVPRHGQYGGHHQGMPGYLPGAIPPYGQGPPTVPPYQGGPPRPPMGMRPVTLQGGRY